MGKVLIDSAGIREDRPVPRINAPTVEEHRARQEALIYAVVGELVAEGGPGAVDLSTVARRVGMARTSLYRYAADADELVGRWLLWVLEPVVESERADLTGRGSPRQRLGRWLDDVVDEAASPELSAATELVAAEGALRPSTRRALATIDEDINGLLTQTVAEALRPRRGRDVEAVAAMVVGVANGARRAVRAGHPPRAVRSEARRALTGLLPA
jgi:AcrR family transcriptional regulator